MMDPGLVDAVLSAVRATWPIANDMEVTLEANPTSVEAGRFAGYRDAGVNRVSMGIQALNDADLKALGRLHSVSEARATFDIARSVFDRVSFDLIYARMGQTPDAWEKELAAALKTAVDLIADGEANAADLITHRVKFSETIDAYEMHRARADNAVKIVIEMPGA